MHTLPNRRFLAAMVLVISFLLRCAVAADKSGVSPNTISLPKGPGSVEGLGESFQPTLNTGTAKYSIGLRLPPGTAGHSPELKLVYEGGAGNGPLGFGWQLPMAFIQRQTDKGIPTYGTNFGMERVDRFVNDLKEELVPTRDGYYFCENEGAFIRYRAINDHWVATLPNGTLLEFGLTETGRIQDAVSSRVFCWMVERETDIHGNTIAYSYSKFDDDQNVNQRYLTGISYGAGPGPWTDFHFVAFEYEDRADWFEDCRPGFVVRTGERLRSVIVGTQGPQLSGHLSGDFNGDGVPDFLVRKYDLAYLQYAGTNSHWSLLARVTPVGADGVRTLPPSSFGYNVCNPPDDLSATAGTIGGENEPEFVMDTERVEFVDLNGDGLPDILKTGDLAHQAYLNLGEATVQGHSAIRWAAPMEMRSESGDAMGFSLNSARTHLADMDGDGLADLVNKAANDDVFYFRNSGYLDWSERQPMTADGELPPAPFGEPDVRTADLDFDKRTDLIRGNGLDYRVWYNFGSNHYSDAVTVPQENAFDFQLASVQIADLNGDRVPDLIRIWPSEVEVTAGLGYGRFATSRSMAIPDLTLDDDQVRKAKLTDVTGDGLADLVIERAGDGNLWYWINLGNYTFSHRKIITGMPTSIGVNSVMRWADINGNGSTDLIYANSQTTPHLQAVDIGQLLNCGVTPNSLAAISNGIGRVTLIGYKPSTVFAREDASAGQPWPDTMPFPVPVVACVTNLDSLGHQYLSKFRYHDGYYDPLEKQFRGFARVEQVDVGDTTAPTLVTRSHFDTGRTYEAMKGKLLRLTAETESGGVFKEDFTAWQIPPRVLLTGTNGQDVHYAHPTGTTNMVKELGQGTERRLQSEMAYDNFGNQTLDADYGVVENGNRSAFDDERITVTEYAINTNAWVLHSPARQEIRNADGAVISRTEHFYDDETFSGNNPGIVTIGNLTMKREWISPSNSTATISSTRTKYDSFGNPITILDPLAIALDGSVSFSKGHAREIAYESRFHTFPIHETIHLGTGKAPLVFRATYDEGFGTVATSTDFNENTTTYGYDTFARLTSIVKPGDTPAYPTVEYDYALAVPFAVTGIVNYVETRQLDKTPGTSVAKRDHYLVARQFVDGQGRKLLTKQEAEAAPGSTAARVVVTEAVQFNARQKPARVLNPFFSTIGGSLDDMLAFENIEGPRWQGQFHNEGRLVTLDLPSAHSTRTDYDATLRATQITNADGTFHRTVYQPLLTRSFDENDNDPASPDHDTPIVHYNDGLGRLIQIEEVTRLNDDGAPGGARRAWTTRYRYDLNDQLIRITDSQNNVKTFAYDALKRKTDMNDPDRGAMHFVYDDASNLTETTDAKGQRITYTYDGANRILTEKYHDGQPSPPWRTSGESVTNSVVYHYDAPYPSLPQGDNTVATARNVRGVLAWVEDLSGEEHTSYDQRGRVEWVVKRIPDPQVQSLVPLAATSIIGYKTSFAYDSLDRPTNLTYPDADQLSYEYNDRNLLQRIPGGPSGSIIANIAYQPSGQVGQIAYGNGVRTAYTYDSRLRLRQLETQNSSLGTELINFAYEFDGVSNIKSIADLRPASSVPEGDSRRNTQLFQYDDLYRLTRVQYSFAVPTGERGGVNGSSNDGEINYRYDRIGNMLAQTSNLNHQEHGLSVANLGQMDSGGSAGRSGRVGRGVNDQPGPHALTRISNQQSQITNRLYGYDGNGNMTNIDGLVCTWDLKDRLVAAENAEMRAAYTYDYTDRRITKRIVWKPGSPAQTGRAGGEGVTTVSYINKHFEVREHETPTKYVWNGNTRVARVTGSLNTNVRVQRLRVYPGWNLSSVAVNGPLSAPGGESQAGVVSFAFKWNPASQDWQPVTLGVSLPAGTVLWLQATTNATLTITGTYADPTNRTVPASGAFLPSAGLEAWNIPSTLSNHPSTILWTYDASFTRWLAWLPPPLELQSDMPAFIAPGQAVFARADATNLLEIPESALRVRYYHQDHLGSSSCMTDGQGNVVEETTNYPFGHPRNHHQPKGLQDPFQFTQKERDNESGLYYFEARLLVANLGRFTRVDPATQQSPQSLNLYSYCANKPLTFVDPTGKDGTWADRYWADPVNRANAAVNEGLGNLVESGQITPVGATIVGTVSDLLAGALTLLPSLGNQIGHWAAEPSLENFPIIGPTGVAIGESTAAVVEDPSLVNVSKAVGAYAQGLGVALGGVQALRSSGLSSATSPKGLESRGFRPPPGTRQIPEGIPKGWRIRPTEGEGGVRYYDPANKGNAVRVMPGDPASPFPNSRSPYVRWQKNGQALDVNGNVVPKNTSDAHIPLQDFKFKQ